LRAGIAAAQHPLICYVPFDRQYRHALLKDFLRRIDKVHLVSGSRRGQPMPGGLLWLGRLYRWTVRVLFGVSVPVAPGWLGWRHRFEHLAYRFLFGLSFHDADCPFRLARRAILAAVPLQSDSSFVHVELLAKWRFIGDTYLDEVSVDWQPVPPGPFRPVYADMRRLLKRPDFGQPEFSDGAPKP
jgi:hypothetical protein